MSEINPNHPVVQEVREQWHKLCALVLWKHGVRELEITSGDIDGMVQDDCANIVVDTRGGRLFLRLVSDEEGQRLARKEGGLPL